MVRGRRGGRVKVGGDGLMIDLYQGFVCGKSILWVDGQALRMELIFLM